MNIKLNSNRNINGMAGIVALLIIVILVAAVLFGPLLTIWALNTLFPVLAIPFGIKQWFAVLVLGGFVGGIHYKSK